MDEDRQQAYLYLIQEVLRCPPGRVHSVLNEHQDLLDAGLVQMMGEMAQASAQRGDRKGADLLSRIARQQAKILGLPLPPPISSSIPNRESQFTFLKQVLDAIASSNSNPQVVYRLLEANLDLLDLLQKSSLG